jgi:hypothetical protein
MSGRILGGFVEFAEFLFDFDRVRCASIGSFLVRNCCGPTSSRLHAPTRAALLSEASKRDIVFRALR